jgi:hypothetical protein
MLQKEARGWSAAVRLKAGGRRLKKRMKKKKYSQAPLVDACL